MSVSRFEGRLRRLESVHGRPFLEELNLDQKRALIAMLEAIDAGEPEPSDEILFWEKLDRGACEAAIESIDIGQVMDWAELAARA